MTGTKVQINELNKLPTALLEQLNCYKSLGKSEDSRFLLCAEKLGGEFIIDKLMIEYYRQYKVVLDRQKTINRITRLVAKKELFAHPKLKGVYSIKSYDA
jgi:hypothetical protein